MYTIGSYRPGARVPGGAGVRGAADLGAIRQPTAVCGEPRTAKTRGRQ